MSLSKPVLNDRRFLWAALCVLFGAGCVALHLQSLLGDQLLATTLVSRPLWLAIVGFLGGSVTQVAADRWTADVGLLPLLLPIAGAALTFWACGAFVIARIQHRPYSQAVIDWGRYGWLWWLLPGVWEVLRLMAFASGWSGLEALLLATPNFWLAFMLAGWGATFAVLATPHSQLNREPASSTADDFRVPPGVWIAAGVYVVVFTAMNWQLYRGLLVPHGDSAMYEEHLWNVTHGKGFRSYLDQGLFLGEHIQVVHLLLLPLYVIWSSHLLLELCESLALASGAIPVFWLARRHTRLALGPRTGLSDPRTGRTGLSDLPADVGRTILSVESAHDSHASMAGVLMAGAYLLYFPMQFLDIAIDLKTFRPIAFGIPLVLFALDQLERGRYRSMVVLLLVALSAKEDYAILLAPLGIWIALSKHQAPNAEHELPLTPHPSPVTSHHSPVFRRWLGGGLALFAAAYLLLATRVVIPWFRGGEEVHYARYFSKFGNTLGEIGWNMLTDPGLLFGELVTIKTFLYAIALLLPAGFLPLFSPGRLAVGLPLFAILSLNEIAQDPRHHFHAPLVPIVFWAAAAGLANCSRLAPRVARRLLGGSRGVGFQPAQQRAEKEPNPTKRAGSKPPPRSAPTVSRETPNASTPTPTIPQAAAPWFVLTSALAAGLFFSLSPLGLTFWDFGSQWHWRNLYVPGKRAELFPKVFEQIPRTARVASTDFIHPRFTHHERSYDYSHYPRKVSGYELRVPDDTEYIVIDTQHPYSEIKHPHDIREYREHPGDWELLPDKTDGYFIVLKRRR